MDFTRRIILSELADAAGCDLADVTDDATLTELGIDSLDAMHAGFSIEKRLGRVILAGQPLEPSMTVGELVAKVEEEMRVEAS